MKYNIGQMLKYKNDTELEGCFGTKKTFKSGTKMFIGVDRYAYHLDGTARSLGEEDVVEGYSTEGLAEWIYIWLRNEFPLDEFFDDYDVSKNKFEERIAEALEELGMYDSTGNRS
jgi:hypothetical protein